MNALFLRSFGDTKRTDEWNHLPAIYVDFLQHIFASKCICVNFLQTRLYQALRSPQQFTQLDEQVFWRHPNPHRPLHLRTGDWAPHEPLDGSIIF